MAVSNGTGTFGIGRDCTVILVGPRGQLQIPNVTGFDIKAETSEVKSRPLDGRILQVHIPDGYTGSLEFDRADNRLEAEFNAAQAAWKLTGALPTYTLYQYVTEPNAGGTTTYQLDNVTIKLDDAGSFKANETVKQKLSFMGDNRRSV